MKKNNCRACQFLRDGVKTKKAIPHTCGKDTMIMNSRNSGKLYNLQHCHYCGKNPGAKQDNKNMWNSFSDKDMNVLVCWICRDRHYKEKAKTEFKNLYTEFPVPIIKKIS